MSVWLLILIGLGVTGLIVAVLKYVRYKHNLERSFNMVFMEIKVPKKESKEDREVEGEQFSNQRDFKEISGGIMMQFFDNLHSIYTKEWYKVFTSQEFLSFEYVVLDGLIHFFIVCPRSLQNIIEKQITAFYPESYVEQIDDYNIFKPKSHVASTYMTATKPFSAIHLFEVESLFVPQHHPLSQF